MQFSELAMVISG